MLDRGLAKDPGDRWESARGDGRGARARDGRVAARHRADAADRAAACRRRTAAGPSRVRRDRGRSGPLRPCSPGSPESPWWPSSASCCCPAATAARTAAQSTGRGGHPSTDASPRKRGRRRRPTPTAEAHARADRDRHAGADRDRHGTPEAPAAEPDLDRASQLQVQGFNARQAGDYDRALTLNQQALEACGDTVQLDPCGYALFEVGAALNALGRPDEAIAPLEQRLEQYGDNGSGEVKDELKKRPQGRAGGKGND